LYETADLEAMELPPPSRDFAVRFTFWTFDISEKCEENA
jgi:hypothetical protein